MSDEQGGASIRRYSDPISRAFYIAPGGDDTAAGTKEAPWATVDKAVQAAEAGTTIYLLPGSYKGVLNPVHSGEADRPVVFKSLRRGKARLVGTEGDDYTAKISGLSHIRLEGLHIEPQSPTGRWLLIKNAQHIVVDDVQMVDALHRLTPMIIDHCDQVKVLNCVLSGSHFNMAVIGNSRHIVVEGCDISRAGHSPLQFYPIGSNQCVVIRGNVFHSGWGRNFELFSTRDVLFESNVIANAVHGASSADTPAKILFDRGVFRFNAIIRNWGFPVRASTYLDTLWFRDVRLYNNVFDGNNAGAVHISSNDRCGHVHNVIFVHNVFCGNDRHGASRQIRIDGGQVQFWRNVFFGQEESDKTVQVGTARAPVGEFEGHGLQKLCSKCDFRGNMTTPPGYVDGAKHNYALFNGSPLLNAGAPLTKAVGEGNGTSLPVEDALYFYDGFGIEGELGDIVAVGDQQLARVLHVDKSANCLELDRIVRWSDGAAVSLPWSGDAPDIGVYEHGRTGRATVQVVADASQVGTGQPVRLSAVVHGNLVPVLYRWWLGDGTTACAPEVEHVYAEAFDYAIRLEVMGADGKAYRGTGYVTVTDPVEKVDLLHTEFGVDDSDSWWKWYTSRPQPVKWQRELADDGSGVLTILVPDEPGGILPCYTFPADWQIDKFPWIIVSYRVAPGIPLGLFLNAFENEDGARSVLAAAVPDRAVNQHKQTDSQGLIADNQWHTITIDARTIRQHYPDVEVLESLGFRLLERRSLQAGLSYSLAEVKISQVRP